MWLQVSVHCTIIVCVASKFVWLGATFVITETKLAMSSNLKLRLCSDDPHSFHVSFPAFDSTVFGSVIEFLNEERNLDIIFLCSNNVLVRSSKVFLATTSGFMKSLIENASDETIFVSLPGIEYDIMDKMLKLLYKGCVIVNSEQRAKLKEVLSLLEINVPIEENVKTLHASKELDIKKPVKKEETPSEGRNSQNSIVWKFDSDSLQEYLESRCDKAKSRNKKRLPTSTSEPLLSVKENVDEKDEPRTVNCVQNANISGLNVFETSLEFPQRSLDSTLFDQNNTNSRTTLTLCTSSAENVYSECLSEKLSGHAYSSSSEVEITEEDSPLLKTELSNDVMIPEETETAYLSPGENTAVQIHGVNKPQESQPLVRVVRINELVNDEPVNENPGVRGENRKPDLLEAEVKYEVIDLESEDSDDIPHDEEDNEGVFEDQLHKQGTKNNESIKKEVVGAYSPLFRYKCSNCEKMFLSNIALKSHMLSSHKDKQISNCRNETLSAEEENIKEVYTSNPPKRLCIDKGSTARPGGKQIHLCKFCNVSFLKEEDYTSHILTHNVVNTYPCKICGKEFIYQASYLKHMSSHG